MVLPDYHVHTSYSPDSKMEPEEAIRVAFSEGNFAQLDKVTKAIALDNFKESMQNKNIERSKASGIRRILRLCEQIRKNRRKEKYEFLRDDIIP